MQRPSLLHRQVLEKQRNQDPACFILNVQQLTESEMECTWRSASTMNGKSRVELWDIIFWSNDQKQTSHKGVFLAMVFKKWEQDCTLVNMPVNYTLTLASTGTANTHTKYNHFYHLSKHASCKEKQWKPAWPQSTQREAGWHSTSGLTMSHKLLWCICAWQ